MSKYKVVLNGGDTCICYCARCNEELKPGAAVGLELDQRIDEYHDFGGIPADQNKGALPFGRGCAKIARAAAANKLNALHLAR